MCVHPNNCTHKPRNWRLVDRIIGQLPPFYSKNPRSRQKMWLASFFFQNLWNQLNTQTRKFRSGFLVGRKQGICLDEEQAIIKIFAHFSLFFCTQWPLLCLVAICQINSKPSNSKKSFSPDIGFLMFPIFEKNSFNSMLHCTMQWRPLTFLKISA